MLSPRLTNCVECSDITTLLSDIDCKLNELASVLYNNTVFSLNLSVPQETMLDLLNYKRILTFKLCNPNYAKKYTLKMIASRVKLLTSGLRNCCTHNKILSNLSPQTTTSTTSATHTTSSTSSTTSTSTTHTLLSPGGPYGITNTICLVCLGATDTVTACSYAIQFPLDCYSYFYDPACTPLQVGCILYADTALTRPVIGNPNEYCSDGINSYQINASGVITSITPCPAPPVNYNHCSSYVIPKIDGTPFNVGPVTVTCTYTGDVTTYPSSWPVPQTLDVFPPNAPWLGKNWNLFSLTFNFSSPVNNINIYQTAGDLNETYKYATNTGTLTLVSHYLNHASIVNGDTIEIDPYITSGDGNSIVEISNSVPFTSLTISGYTTPGRPTNSWGSLFAICTQIV